MLSVVLKSEFGTAKLSLPLFVWFSCCSRYVVFVKLIHLNDLLDDVTFPLSTNQKPRRNLHTHGRHTDDTQTYRKVAYRARLPSLKISTLRASVIFLRPSEVRSVPLVSSKSSSQYKILAGIRFPGLPTMYKSALLYNIIISRLVKTVSWLCTHVQISYSD